jgi:hypothetical protein
MRSKVCIFGSSRGLVADNFRSAVSQLRDALPQTDRRRGEKEFVACVRRNCRRFMNSNHDPYGDQAANL